MKRDPRLVRLSWDHHRGLVLARDIERALADGDAAAVYSRLLAEWAAGLLPHFRGEQECLLARLLRASPGDDAIGRTLDDHLAIEALVVTMRDSPDAALRQAALGEFARQLKAHIRWEESVLFPRTEAALGEEGLDALARDLAEQLPPFEATLPPEDDAAG